jgi:hypothetical protein
MATAQIEHNHTARSHDEARQLFRFAQTAFSQRFQRSRKNLLCKVFRSAFVSQVTESVEPNPWGHTVDQLALGCGVDSAADPPHQVCIADLEVHNQHLYV